MKYLLTISLVLILIFANSCKNANRSRSKDHHSEPVFINIHGANALYPLVQSWVDVYVRDHKGTRINVFPSSSTKGITDVMQGFAGIGMYSGPTTENVPDGLILVKVARDAVVLTVNAENPSLAVLESKGIGKSALKGIFVTREDTSWSQVTGSGLYGKIEPCTRSDASGAASAFADFLGCRQEDLAGLGVYGDAGMTQAIRNNAYAIGYDNLRYVFDNATGLPYQGIRVVPIDFNDNGTADQEENTVSDLESVKNAIRSGAYPYPLARELNLLIPTEGNSPEVLEFLHWVLTEGVDLIDRAGYVRLSPEDYSRGLEQVNGLNP